MKNSVMFIWGILIVTLCSLVFAIGLYEQKNEERLTVERAYKEAARKFLKEHDSFPDSNESITVMYEDLKKEDFIDEVKYKDKECVGNVTVSKKFIFYKYETSIKCE